MAEGADCAHGNIERHEHTLGGQTVYHWVCRDCREQFAPLEEMHEAVAAVTKDTVTQVIEVSAALTWRLLQHAKHANGVADSDAMKEKILDDLLAGGSGMDQECTDHKFSQGLCLKCGVSQFLGGDDDV